MHTLPWIMISEDLFTVHLFTSSLLTILVTIRSYKDISDTGVACFATAIKAMILSTLHLHPTSLVVIGSVT